MPSASHAAIQQSDDWVADVRERGYCRFARYRPRPKLEDICRELQITRADHKRLVAVASEEARPNSLSSRYGLGALPLHTDGILERLPPRYVMLFSPRRRPTQTVVFDSRSLDPDLRRNAVFIGGPAGRKVYQRFESVTDTRGIVRYNAAIFEPQNEAARSISASIAGAEGCSGIDWTETLGVVIDNWRMLHGRRRIEEFSGESIRRITGWTAA